MICRYIVLDEKGRDGWTLWDTCALCVADRRGIIIFEGHRISLFCGLVSSCWLLAAILSDWSCLMLLKTDGHQHLTGERFLYEPFASGLAEMLERWRRKPLPRAMPWVLRVEIDRGAYFRADKADRPIGNLKSKRFRNVKKWDDGDITPYDGYVSRLQLGEEKKIFTARGSLCLLCKIIGSSELEIFEFLQPLIAFTTTFVKKNLDIVVKRITLDIVHSNLSVSPFVVFTTMLENFWQIAVAGAVCEWFELARSSAFLIVYQQKTVSCFICFKKC